MVARSYAESVQVEEPPSTSGQVPQAVVSVKLLLTLDEAAEALGIHKTFLYTRLLEPGHIFSIKLGSRRLVPMLALTEYVDRLIAEQKAS